MSDANTNAGSGEGSGNAGSGTGTTEVADANKGAANFSSADLTKLVNDQVSSKIKEVESKTVDKITSKIVSSLKGEEDRSNPIHDALIEDPEGLMTAVINQAKDEATKSIRTEMQVQKEIDDALTPVYAEFPELKKIRREILAEFGETDPKASYGKRAVEVANNVAKRMGWKSESEKRNEKETDSATMSPTSSSGYSSSRPEMQGAVKTLNDSAKSFFQNRKKQFEGYRTKEASKG